MDEIKVINYMKKKKYIENEYICWNFVQDVYKDEYDISLPDYPVDEVQAEFKHKLASNFPCKKIQKDEKILEGDVIVFSLFANQHAGVMIDSENFIHLKKTGVAVSNINNLGKNYEIYRKN